MTGDKGVQLITEMTMKLLNDSRHLWEERLKLYVKPRPSWIPVFVWRRLVGLVLIQTKESK